MVRTYWILGEGGWIGGKIYESFKDEYNIKYLPKRHITSKGDIVGILTLINPNDVIINCIGYTGVPNVDACEENKFETLLANTLIPFWLGIVASRKKAKVVHLSTGCIYNGNKNFKEEDTPNYTGSFYSQTKMVGESAFNIEKDLILRIRLPFSTLNESKNSLTKLLKYDKIINELNSITFVDDLINVIEELAMKNEVVGIFNVVNPQPVKHKEIMDIIAPGKEIDYITMKELRTMTVADRSNCTLSTKKLSKYYKMTNTLIAIKDCANKMGLVK